MKYRFGKRPRLSARDIQLLLLIGLVSIAVLGTLMGADLQLSRELAGGGGFFAPWQAARAFLFEHGDPYGTTVASRTQQQVYGQTVQPGQNPYRLTLPFFLLPAYYPLAFVADAATARGIWLFLNEATLVGMAVLVLRTIEWQPKRALQAGVALVMVFCVYSVMSLLEGGPAVLLGLLYCGILYAYSTEQEELAGALLALVLFSWEIGLLFVVLLIWKTGYEKRWRIWAGFGMMLLVLVVISLLSYPAWLLPFVVASLANLRAPFGTTSAAILERLSPAYGEHAAQAGTVLLILLLVYEWAATRHADTRRFIWTACLTLALTPLLGLRIEVENLVVMLPGIALICAGIASRWRTGYWQASLLLIIVLLLPWGWFVRWYVLQDSRAYDNILLFLPLFTSAGLYLTRWWFLRPPRTWYDHVRSTLSATQPLKTSRNAPGSTGPGLR